MATTCAPWPTSSGSSTQARRFDRLEARPQRLLQVRRAPGCSAGRARPRRPTLPHRARRASVRPGRARPHRRARRRAVPGSAAIRASNCRSRMKFWPSDLLALSPWRAMTSRSGSGVRDSSGFGAQARAFCRHADGRRHRPRDRRGPGRQCRTRCRDPGAVRTIGRPSVTLTRFLEMERLDRDQRLVVVHAQARRRSSARARAWNMVSAGWGPVTRQPSAASAAIAGAMTSISSRPRLPPSPAWGLRPETASRGSAMPKLPLQPAERRAAARFDQGDGEAVAARRAAAGGSSPAQSAALDRQASSRHCPARCRSVRRRTRSGPDAGSRSRRAAPSRLGR